MSEDTRQDDRASAQEKQKKPGDLLPENCREETEEKLEDEHRTIHRKKVHWKSFAAGAAAAVAVLAAAGTIYFLSPVQISPKNPASLGTLKKIAELKSTIQAHYYGDVSDSDLTESMMSGLVSGLGDKYSAYYSEEEYSKIRLANKGYTQGIGISVQQEEDGTIQIVYVQKESPADQAGLKENDVLTAVNGTSVEGLSVSDVVKLIQGSDDTSVEVSYTREGTDGVQTVSMEKSNIEIYSVSGGFLQDDSTIGYIRITKFNGTTSDQFKEIYDQMKEENMKGLIIDLRDNLGGQVSGCCDVLEQILPKGVLVYERDKNGREQTRDCKGETPIEIPLAVLVNENTASASEIFTGAVQDYGVGTIVGTQTYGKGIEQNPYTLSDGSVVKLTTTHYFTPDKRDINGVGITPDIEVENDEDSDTDSQFQKALETVQSQIGETEEKSKTTGDS